MVATSGSRPAGKRRRHRPAGGAVPPGHGGDTQHPRGPGAVWRGTIFAAPRTWSAAARAHRGCRTAAPCCARAATSLNDANDLPVPPAAAAGGSPASESSNPNTHGTGCTLSSAIAANLAKGHDLETAVATAKEYLSGALAAMLDLGHGSGPLDHAYSLRTHKED